MRKMGWYFAVFCVGFLGYPLAEFCYRGSSHITMAYLGGASGVLLGWLCTLPLWRIAGAFLGAVGILVMELLVGLWVNVYLQLGVWDYSRMPYHLWGQICPTYFLVWWGLSLAVLWVLTPIYRRLTAPVSQLTNRPGGLYNGENAKEPPHGSKTYRRENPKPRSL